MGVDEAIGTDKTAELEDPITFAVQLADCVTVPTVTVKFAVQLPDDGNDLTQVLEFPVQAPDHE